MVLPRLIEGSRRTLLASLIANGLLQASAALASAYLIGFVFDRMVQAPQALTPAGLGWATAGLVLGIPLLTWLRLRERVDAERLGQRYVHEIRLILFERLAATPPRTLQARSRGGTLLRFIGDLTALRQWVSLGVARLAVAGVAISGVLIALAVVSWPLALAITVALSVGAGAAALLGTSLRRAVKESRQHRASLAGNVNEKIASMAVVQVCGQVRRERARIERQSLRLVDAMVARARMAGLLRGTTDATGGAAGVGALLLGAALVSADQATPGTVVGAMSLVGLLTPALRDLGRVLEYWHGARVSREKIESFLALAPTSPVSSGSRDTTDLAAAGRLEFNGAGAGQALQPFSAGVKSGARVAIVGPNGSGKSTLLALVARLELPDSGTVTLDGKPIAELPPRELRRSVGMVSPDLPLLRGSLEKNLRYRWPRAPREELQRVLALCGVDALIRELPRGLETRIVEGGMNLSVGQRRRIELARALLGAPQILLLDEVEANLDPATALVLGRALSQFTGTVLMATHRLERVAFADTVWYLDAGQLVESGPPGNLLSGHGPTARLFRREMARAS
jgi:ABC-type multidrug transport system fused ATPase/permease subunit